MTGAAHGPRTALVTGGASGIGREISLAYARKGWDVLCLYRASAAEAAGLAGEIQALGRACETTRVDLADADATAAFAAGLRQRRIDALVNNAGSYVAPKPFQELTDDDLTVAFRLNVFAPTILCGAVFDGMRQRGFGRIVNISSVAAKYGGSAVSLHYGQAKRALEGLTRTLGREGAGVGVLANTVRPGVVDTPFHTKFPKDMGKRAAMIPAKRLALPGEVAGIVVFLGSEDNSYITRECIAVAGGE